MALHVTDGEIWEIAPDMPTALSWCSERISIVREHCDPEWPESVTWIAIYDAPHDAEEPDEVGRLLARSEQFDRQPCTDGSCDYYCDYRMRAL